MNIIKFLEEKSIENIYKILKIVFFYGEDQRLCWASPKGLKWLKENELDRLISNSSNSNDVNYLSKFGGFKINIAYGSEEEDKGFLLFESLLDEGRQLTWVNTTTGEYIHLDYSWPINLDFLDKK